MRVHSKNRKLSVKRNKTNRKRQQRNKRSTKSRVRGGVYGGPWNWWGSVGGPGKYPALRVAPRYTKDDYNHTISIYEGFDYIHDESGRRAFNYSSARIFMVPNTEFKIKVDEPSLRNAETKAIIENDICNALKEYVNPQIASVNINGDTLQVN